MRGWLARGDAPEEDRDYAGLAVRVLPRPVDVRVPKGHVLCPVQAVVGAEVLLGRELRRPVGRDRLQGRVLGRRPLALAVDRTARRGEDQLRAVRARCLEHPDRPEDVDVAVEDGLLDRPAHVGLRREMEADVRPRFPKRLVEHAPRHGCPRRPAGLSSFSRSRLPVARLSTTTTSSPRADERVDEVRPDEARAACDNRPHVLVS